jgi:hypothetical protein
MNDSVDHQTIRKKCTGDWPDDFQMQDYCEVQQLKAVSGTGTTAVPGSATPTITAKCAKDWPDDFQMRKYCQDKQAEGFAALQARTMDNSADRQTIRKKCASDWPDDFQMRDYCEVQQLKALGAIIK